MRVVRYTRSNLRCHELIGLEVEVLDHSDKGLVGLVGRVVWETKNTFVVESSGRELTVPKQQGVFSFKLPNSGYVVKMLGDEVLRRPEERVKMCGDAR